MLRLLALLSLAAVPIAAQSVTVSPPTKVVTITTKIDSLKVSDTLRGVTAEVKSAPDANGRTYTSTTTKVRWSTNPAGVVRVIDTTGNNGQRVSLVGLAPDSVSVIGTWNRSDGTKVSGSYRFRVTGSPPPIVTQPPVVTPPIVIPPPTTTPPPTGSGVHYFDDFSKYTTSAQLNSGVMAKGNFWWGPDTITRAAGHDYVNVPNKGAVSLDVAERAMRYDWPDRSTSPCTGSEYTVGVHPRINPVGVVWNDTSKRDMYVEFITKESPLFAHGNYSHTAITPRPSDPTKSDTVVTICGGRSYKFFLLQFEKIGGGMLGRAGTYLGDGVPVAPLGPKDPHLSTTFFMDISDQKGAYDYKGGIPIGGAGGWGGAYHRWLIELKGIGTPSATFTTYLDYQKLYTLTTPFLNGESIHSGFVVYLEMGANVNNGPSKAQSRWWRQLGVYSIKPGGYP